MGWIPELILSSYFKELYMNVMINAFSNDAAKTKETLQILQEHAQGFSEAEVYFMPSFYSIAAMDDQAVKHLRKAICEYLKDEILIVIYFYWVAMVSLVHMFAKRLWIKDYQFLVLGSPSIGWSSMRLFYFAIYERFN